MEITNILIDRFLLIVLLTSMSWKQFLNFFLRFNARLIGKTEHIYQATNTLLKSHSQLHNKNIHINFSIFSLWKMQQLSSCG